MTFKYEYNNTASKKCILKWSIFIQDKKATGRKADVILAAYNAAEAALRLLKPGSNVIIDN